MFARGWRLVVAEEVFEGPFAFPADGFVEAMDRQKAELIAFFKGIPEERFASAEGLLPAGASMPLGAALMNGPLKWLTAYKLQLFLYAKAAGADEISTVNAWAGVDKR